MRTQIKHIVEEYWVNRFPALLELVADTTRQIENFLVLEDYYRGASKEDARFTRQFGGFGGESLDVKALSSVLSRSYDARTMEKARLQRMQAIHGELNDLRATYEKAAPPPRFVELDSKAQPVLDAFEDHIAGVTKAFRLMRIARLEARGRYNPAEHDAFFEAFNWRQLDNTEMALCPPFVAFSTPWANLGEYMGELMQLLTSGRPVKVALLQPTLFNGVSESGRAAALKGTADAALMFLSLRNVYFLQTSLAAEAPLGEQFAQGLDSPRPGVFSLFATGENGKPSEAAVSRARMALQSRGFPHFAYDPDKADDFVSCLELRDNPALDALWPTVALEYLTDDGEPAQLERPYTFADFAATEADFKGQFHPLGAEEEARAVPLADFMALKPGERRDKVPFIQAVDEQKHLVRLVPSQSVVSQSFDRLHLWRTLQELEGIRNPHVQAAEQRISSQLSEEREKAVAEVKAQLEAQMSQRSEEAVSQAMRNLAARLTGMAVSGPAAAPVQAPAAAPGAPAAAPAPEAAAPAAAEEEEEEEAAISETPWIDDRLCTTCDECVNINKKIFAYNANKKAYIADPKGGPYKDIVRAAEKCSSGAIHPGLPLDPNEKDAEKWIKRAEPFQ